MVQLVRIKGTKTGIDEKGSDSVICDSFAAKNASETRSW